MGFGREYGSVCAARYVGWGLGPGGARGERATVVWRLGYDMFGGSPYQEYRNLPDVGGLVERTASSCLYYAHPPPTPKGKEPAAYNHAGN